MINNIIYNPTSYTLFIIYLMISSKFFSKPLCNWDKVCNFARKLIVIACLLKNNYVKEKKETTRNVFICKHCGF